MKIKRRKIPWALLWAPLLSLILLLAAFLVSLLFGYEAKTDVAYGPLPEEKMDIYFPKGEEAYRGGILFLHGGSWQSGDKREEEINCRFLASRGYLTATVNYTLYSEEKADTYTVDAVLDEIDLAIQTLTAVAGERGIVLDRVALGGYSAGAHLALLYSLTRADTSPLEISFAASLAGPADLSAEVFGEDLSLRIGQILSGQALTAGEMAEQILALYSPVTHINSDTPPLILAYGGRDTLVSPKNGEALKAGLDAHGVRYDYLYFKASDHMMIQNPLMRLRYMYTLRDYCREFFTLPTE